MKKIINPCMYESCSSTGKIRSVRAFAKISYENGRLSITGVVNPRRGGNCDCAGQCVDSIREGKPIDEWTDEMLQKFCDIWEEWHLNDTKPYCVHQKELVYIKKNSVGIK